MDPNEFDALARKAAGTRRATLRAIVIGAIGTVAGMTGADAGRRKRRRKKKEKCTSHCEGRCCKKGTKAALLFDTEGFGCKCCPKQRIWRGGEEGHRCCPAGTRAVVGFTTNGGPCCPEKQYCDGECCNDGYVCSGGECQEECIAARSREAQLQTGAARGGDVSTEGAQCAWPGNAQQACIDGYVCTERFVCCRPEDTPCGGYPGQHGACCQPGETCNPEFDADPDNLDLEACLPAC